MKVVELAKDQESRQYEVRFSITIAVEAGSPAHALGIAQDEFSENVANHADCFEATVLNQEGTKL